MQVKSLNYNLGSPSELIHKFQKDQELVSRLELHLRGLLETSPSAQTLPFALASRVLYFACCHHQFFRTLGEEYAYLTHLHPEQQLFIWRRRRLLFFLLRTFGPTILLRSPH